jgi:PadR family transcriptional regulator PadR
VKRFLIGELEKAVLATILGLSNEASGHDIRATLRDGGGRLVSVGALYATLDRLVEKGFLEFQVRDGDGDRGGRKQRCFRLTGEGEFALTSAFDEDSRLQKFAYGEVG